MHIVRQSPRVTTTWWCGCVGTAADQLTSSRHQALHRRQCHAALRSCPFAAASLDVHEMDVAFGGVSCPCLVWRRVTCRCTAQVLWLCTACCAACVAKLCRCIACVGWPSCWHRHAVCSTEWCGAVLERFVAFHQESLLSLFDCYHVQKVCNRWEHCSIRINVCAQFLIHKTLLSSVQAEGAGAAGVLQLLTVAHAQCHTDTVTCLTAVTLLCRLYRPHRLSSVNDASALLLGGTQTAQWLLC